MENRTLDPAITDIINRASNGVVWDIKASFITEKGKVFIPNVVNLIENRDYDESYFPIRLIDIQISQSALKAQIYPFKDNLDLELILVKKGARNGSEGTYKRLYKAKLTQHFDQSLLSIQKEKKGDRENDLNLITLTLQLQEPVEYDYQFYSTGGIFQDQKLDNILKVMMAPTLVNKDLAKNQLILDNTSILRGVSVITPSRTKPLNNIIIEEGTKIVDLPGYLQEKYGIYSSGCGWFMQNGWWYIYPKYDYTLFHKSNKTLTIVNLNPSEYPLLDKSFLKSNNKLFVLSSGYSSMDDQSESYALGKGNGLKYVRASDVRKNFKSVSNNKVTANNNNVKKFAISERNDGLFNVNFIEEKFTDNPYTETGRMTRGLGMTFDTNWDRGEINLLYPGMPVEVIFPKGNTLKRRYGNLLSVTSATTSKDKSIAESEYITNAKLKVYLSHQEK